MTAPAKPSSDGSDYPKTSPRSWTEYHYAEAVLDALMLPDRAKPFLVDRFATAIAAAEQRGEERGRAEGRREALALDQPWPVRDILLRLAAAADHLFSHHTCDAHDWESTAAARDAAHRFVAALAREQPGGGK